MITTDHRDTAGYKNTPLTPDQRYALDQLTTGLENVSGDLASFIALLNFIADALMNGDGEGAREAPRWFALRDALKSIERQLDDQIDDLSAYCRGEIFFPTGD